MLIANHTAYGFSYFYPTIVSGFNLGSRTITLVLTAPPYLLATCSAFAVAYSSDKNNERGWHVSVPMGFAVIGFIISVATLNVGARYFASFIFICGCYSSNAGVFSWASSTLNQTPEKKAAAVALINLMSQLGNIWSPYCKMSCSLSCCNGGVDLKLTKDSFSGTRRSAICHGYDTNDGLRCAERYDLHGHEVLVAAPQSSNTGRLRGSR